VGSASLIDCAIARTAPGTRQIGSGLIEDDPSVQATLQLRYQLFIAHDGVEGLRLFAMVRPELVITDIIMPAADGFAVIKEIRKEPRPMKIIAVSGGARLYNVETLAMAEKLGADHVIQKPFEPEELLAAVGACLTPPGSVLAQRRQRT
jgi:DNA-binding response OmpR family regulator